MTRYDSNMASAEGVDRRGLATVGPAGAPESRRASAASCPSARSRLRSGPGGAKTSAAVQPEHLGQVPTIGAGGLPGEPRLGRIMRPAGWSRSRSWLSRFDDQIAHFFDFAGRECAHVAVELAVGFKLVIQRQIDVYARHDARQFELAVFAAGFVIAGFVARRNAGKVVVEGEVVGCARRRRSGRVLRPGRGRISESCECRPPARRRHRHTGRESSRTALSVHRRRAHPRAPFSSVTMPAMASSEKRNTR